jgi:hypothetical protein
VVGPEPMFAHQPAREVVAPHAARASFREFSRKLHWDRV